MSVGFVGLGNMGSVLAANLVASGATLTTHDLAGSDRSPTGATFVGSVGELAGRVETVVLSLPDGHASRAVTAELLGSPESTVRLVIDTSTVGVDAAREVAASCGARGVGFVDAPVSGGVAGARARTLTVMYSGAADHCAAAGPVLAGLSDRRRRVGDQPGMAQAVKLLNNFLSATSLAATSEALVFADRLGLDMGIVLDVLNISSGRSAATEDKFPNHVLTGAYASGFAASLMAKDVRLYLDSVAAERSPCSVGRATGDVWSRFAQSAPDADFTRIFPFVAEE